MEKQSSLNLLPSRAKYQAFRVLVGKGARRAALLLGIFWAVGSLLVGAGWWWTESVKSRQALKLSAANREYVALAESVALTDQLKYRAKIVGQLLATRKEYGTMYQSLRSAFPSGMVLESTELTTNETFKIEAAVTGLKSMDAVEDWMAEVNRGSINGLSKLNLESVSVIGDSWKIKFEILLKPRQENE